MKKNLQESVLEVIVSLSHATINDIYCDLRAFDPKITKRRIENSVKKLLENKTIDELKLDGFDNHYELAKGPHNHFVCKECGRVVNINSQVVIPNNDLDGNEVEEVKITIYGICKDCNKDDSEEVIN